LQTHLPKTNMLNSTKLFLYPILQFIILVGSFSFAQESVYDIDKQNQIDTYLGEIDGNHYFYSKYRFFCEESSITIFKQESDQLIEVKKLPKDLYGVELFVLNNSVYCLSLSNNNAGSKDLILTKYDSDFTVIESNILCSLKGQQFLNFRFRKTDNSFGLVAKSQETYFIRHNLLTQTTEVSSVNSKTLGKHVCSDLAVNDNLQMKIIYDSYELENDPVFISCDKNDVIPISIAQEVKFNENHLRCFRFTQSNDTLLLTSLLFSNRKSRKIIGYTYSRLDFTKSETPVFTRIINPFFNDEALWTPGEFKDWSNDKFNDNTCNQLMKQVILHQGTLYFFSQGSMMDPNRYNTFQPVATMPYTNVIDRRYQIASNTNHAPSDASEITDYAFKLLDILVSSVNISDNKVNWSYKSFNLQDPHNSSRVIHNIWEPNFAIHFQNENLQLISNYSHHEFNDEGILEPKKKAASLSSTTTPVKIDINLSSGENTTTPLLGTTGDGLPKSKLIAEAFTVSKDGILIAVLYNLGKGITQFLENYWVTHLKL
jgi:hypothetical protein